MRLRKYLLFILVSLYCFDLQAIPVRHLWSTLVQPDGYTFVVRNIGDEWLHVSMTSEGAAVIQDEDGWYSYAVFDADGNRSSSGVHVGPGADPDVKSEAGRIPWQALRYIAASRRSLPPYLFSRPNLIRRINAQHPVTKAGSTAIQKHGLIFLVEYKDVKFSNPKSSFDGIINGSGPSTALAYFNDQFGGKYEFQFDILGPVPLLQDQSYYGGNDSKGNDKHPEEMVVEACEYYKETVDFSKYDDDGDGEIDNVFVFFAGKDEADDQARNKNCVWSHQWYVKDGAHITKYYNGKLLNNYACTSELMRSMTTGGYKMASIGTFCHEYTHTFGVPDFYDANYTGTGGTADAWWQSIGLMCAANSNNDGHTPPNYNSVERMELELAEPVELTYGDYTLEPIQKNGRFFIVHTDDPGEYYLIENRNNNGWDQYLPGAGMLIYHIDKSTRETGVDDDGDACTALSRWELLNLVNAWPAHQCADLIEADVSLVGQYAKAESYDALRSMEKRIFWPYNSVKAFSAYSSPAFTFWSGAGAPIAISNIAFSGENITFTVGESFAPPSVQSVTKSVFQDAALLSWESSDATFEGEAVLRYGQDEKNMKEVSVTPNTPGKFACWVEGLTPKTAYKVRILFKVKGVEGTVDQSANFTTSQFREGAHPFIWLDSASRTTDGYFISGSKIPLRVWNAIGASVKWTVDGASVQCAGDGWFEVKRSGTLVAEVPLADGSKDVIVKKITVK